jgi:predicted dehydrogenase
MIIEFVDSIRKQRIPAVTGCDGLKATEIALAAYRSAALREPVKLLLE